MERWLQIISRLETGGGLRAMSRRDREMALRKVKACVEQSELESYGL